MSGISIQMVIGIIIGLIVLAIGTTIMFGSSDNFSEGTSCIGEGGRCVESDRCDNGKLSDAATQACNAGGSGEGEGSRGMVCCRIDAVN